MGILNLFVAALIPVLKVLLLTAVGSLLAVDRIGILGHDARKHLNTVRFYCNLKLFLSIIHTLIAFALLLVGWRRPVQTKI